MRHPSRQRCPFRFTYDERLFGTPTLIFLFDGFDCTQLVFPGTFERARDKPVFGLDSVILPSCPFGLVAASAAIFLLMKLVEISRQEDCFLGGGRNCARLQVPSNR
jgi:hypothetical protein